MKSKNLLLVFNRDNKIFRITEESTRYYAEKIGCDYEVMNCNSQWDKLKLFSLFSNYNRILSLNENIIIRKDSPNLFDIVPETELGVLDEGKYLVRVDKIKLASFEYGLEVPKWDGKYYNDGVILSSRLHKKIFKGPQKIGSEFASYMNLMIANNEVKIFELDHTFNRMHFMDDKVGVVRFGSYFLHYQDAPENIVENSIKSDLETWEKDFPNYNYKRNLLLSISAGMGDQLCAEPAIRYTQKLYPDDNLYIVTHFPRLFEHIDVPCYTYDEFKAFDQCFIKLRSCPEDSESDHHMSHVFFHPTDFATMSMIRKTIPNHDKTIQLKLKPEETK